VCGHQHGTRQHEIEPFPRLQTVAEVKAQGPVAVMVAAAPAAPALCTEHPDEPLKLWCDTCNRTICRDCIVVDHRTHDFNFLPAMFEKHRPELEAALEEVQVRIEPAERAVEALQGMELALTARCDEVCGEVTEHMDEFAVAVQQRKRASWWNSAVGWRPRRGSGSRRNGRHCRGLWKA
jgi:hypothetical protein